MVQYMAVYKSQFLQKIVWDNFNKFLSFFFL